MYWLILTHFMSLVSFYTPWKHQKTRVFWCFREVQNRPVTWNGLMYLLLFVSLNVGLFTTILTICLNYMSQNFEISRQWHPTRISRHKTVGVGLSIPINTRVTNFWLLTQFWNNNVANGAFISKSWKTNNLNNFWTPQFIFP